MDDLVRVIVGLAGLVLACIVHECAHVWAAWKLGDPTGKSLGRLTLNPIPHIDLFWTILLPGIMLATGGMPIGGPKPAPVNPLNFKNPSTDMMLVAVAGPVSNVLQALLAILLLWTGSHVAPGWFGPESLNAYLFFSFAVTNLMLAALNMIPIPPLDGSRVLRWLMGPRYEPFFQSLEFFSILLVLLAFRFLGPSVVGPTMKGLAFLLANLFDQDYLLRLFRTYWDL